MTSPLPDRKCFCAQHGQKSLGLGHLPRWMPRIDSPTGPKGFMTVLLTPFFNLLDKIIEDQPVQGEEYIPV
jgi:hypothetical protein